MTKVEKIGDAISQLVKDFEEVKADRRSVQPLLDARDEVRRTLRAAPDESTRDAAKRVMRYIEAMKDTPTLNDWECLREAAGLSKEYCSGKKPLVAAVREIIRERDALRASVVPFINAEVTRRIDDAKRRLVNVYNLYDRQVAINALEESK